MIAEHTITLGVSACLLGQEVRYDGRHKRQDFIANTLTEYFEIKPLCPEVAIGLGVPRPAIRLSGDPSSPRARGVTDPGVDVTEPLRAYACEVAAAYPTLSGYIFKSRSPSCGIRDAPIYHNSAEPVTTGAGIYAGTLLSRRPLLPAIDEIHLMKYARYESFIHQVSAYHRWMLLESAGLSLQGLQEFHNNHEWLLMAHSPDKCRFLRELAAAAPETQLQDAASEYIHIFMQAFRSPCSRGAHAGVLSYLVREYLGAADHDELLEAVAEYSRGAVAWNRPAALIHDRLERIPDIDLQRQFYLNPHPALICYQGSAG
jgi:uncharacterized protein YbbK (DUF523 family)/uncharacterized protein YbgA (DUF1722 family)